MIALIVRTLALIVCALSLGLSFAHLLEAPPRLLAWPAELWRDATVFHGQYLLFGSIGGPIEVAGVLLASWTAYLAWRNARARGSAIAAAVLFAVALAVWLAVVSPANGIMAAWRPGPLPADFSAVQHRWETGHIVMAVLKLVGFCLLAVAVVSRRTRRVDLTSY